MTNPTRMITNLKGCPFCGAEARDPRYLTGCNLTSGWHIECSKGCVSMVRLLMANVVEAWNRREGMDHD